MNNARLDILRRELSSPDQLSQCRYSIALAALVPGPQQDACLQWLLEHVVETSEQTASLSWQDTYVTSYATALALRMGGMRDLSDGILTALGANRNTEVNTETLSFGGLISALDRFSDDCFGFVIQHSAAVQSAIRGEAGKWQKLLLWDQIFDPAYSIAGFSAECLYGLPVNLDRFYEAFSFPDGSVVRSASASAMTLLNYVSHQQDAPQPLVDYVYRLNPFERTIGVFDELTNFLSAWSLMYAGLDSNDVESLPEVEALRRALARSPRIGAAGDTITPELDTGSVAMLAVNWPHSVRRIAIEKITPLMFDGNVYRTFLFERNPSVSTNVHVLAAWPENPYAEKIWAWLQSELDGSFDHWLCKWHISPFYVIGEIGRLMTDINHPIARRLATRALYLLLATQRTDGGWGLEQSTTEETAYAVMALLNLSQQNRSLDSEIHASLSHAHTTLARAPDYTPLWIGKTLYCLRPLVRVVQNIALDQIETRLGSDE